MHPSTAMATVIVDELIRGGVQEAVIAPGSRSAPLAYALAAASDAGMVRLHVRIDERSAAFLALGLAKASGLPVPVVTTSGTAVANLHPAVLEAHHSGVPLIVLSTDRPSELRGTGANQTTTQPGIFAGATRWEADLPAAERKGGQVAFWRASVCRALVAARGSQRTESLPGTRSAGPVHVNLALREPLAPDLEAGAQEWPEPLAGRPGGRPWVQIHPDAGVQSGLRTVVLLGDLPDPEQVTAALNWAAAAGWPVLAEPFGRLPIGGTVVPHGVLAAGAAVGRADLRHDRVVVIGRLTLFREFGALLRLPGAQVEQISAVPDWTDPSHVVRQVHPVSVLSGPPPARHEDAEHWLDSWRSLGRECGQRVRQVALGEPDLELLTGPAIAATVAAALGETDTLVLGSSNAPRDLAIGLGALPQQGAPRVVSSRGLAGIDGLVSTAVGVALTQAGRTIALMGDLTFLHDINGLLIGPGEPAPDLIIVVVNDNGGGIFSTLEYGEPERSATAQSAALTERLFGTPHGTDLASVCAAHGIRHSLIDSRAALARALDVSQVAPGSGIQVVEVRVDRNSHRALRDQLR